NVVEIGYFDRGPIHEERLVLGGYWSSYWYDGRIYGTEIVRGLDVFELTPGDFMSESEIAAAALADQGALFNPQQQFAVTWPSGAQDVALAYLDQLEREEAISSSDVSDLRSAIEAAGSTGEAGNARRAARNLNAAARDLDADDFEGRTAARVAGLKTSLEDMAAELR
ncbi:MAG: DUF305 domain-containing protein, partial [Pseudomonadota bacterium]